jgi:hypothetical protein
MSELEIYDKMYLKDSNILDWKDIYENLKF